MEEKKMSMQYEQYLSVIQLWIVCIKCEKHANIAWLQYVVLQIQGMKNKREDWLVFILGNEYQKKSEEEKRWSHKCLNEKKYGDVIYWDLVQIKWKDLE